jgi:hypothetical protein
LSWEWFLSCYTCCDTGPQFFVSFKGLSQLVDAWYKQRGIKELF